MLPLFPVEGTAVPAAEDGGSHNSVPKTQNRPDVRPTNGKQMNPKTTV